MMVMFLFEFAVLTISSCQTGLRYLVSLVEAHVVRLQTRERRRQIKEQRAEALRQRETDRSTQGAQGEEPLPAEEPLPTEEDVDEMDIEVPGWEAKGQWVLGLDLLAGKSPRRPKLSFPNPLKVLIRCQIS
jgi:E3 ubiquitin-protein ligase synoviolin